MTSEFGEMDSKFFEDEEFDVLSVDIAENKDKIITYSRARLRLR